MRRSRLLLRLVASSAALAAAAWLGIWSIPMSGVAYAADGAKKQGEVMRVSGDVQPPRRLSGDNPVYPKLPRDEKIEGKAILDCVIDTRGKITSIAVAQSAGHADLDQAARDAVATWTFAPATLGGKPVSVYYTITLNFQLDSEKNPKKVG